MPGASRLLLQTATVFGSATLTAGAAALFATAALVSMVNHQFLAPIVLSWDIPNWSQPALGQSSEAKIILSSAVRVSDDDLRVERFHKRKSAKVYKETLTADPVIQTVESVSIPKNEAELLQEAHLLTLANREAQFSEPTLIVSPLITADVVNVEVLNPEPWLPVSVKATQHQRKRIKQRSEQEKVTTSGVVAIHKESSEVQSITKSDVIVSTQAATTEVVSTQVAANAVPEKSLDGFTEQKEVSPTVTEESTPSLQASQEQESVRVVGLKALPQPTMTQQCSTDGAQVYIEALSHDRQIVAGYSETMTREMTSHGCSAGWRVVKAAEHLSTLYLSGRTGSQADTDIPIISKNTVLILARSKGIDLQANTGIILGRVAPEWLVKMSGGMSSSSTVYFIEADQREVSAFDTRRERAFVIFGVSPGTHLLEYIPSNKHTSEMYGSGAIGLPVLPGAATWVGGIDPKAQDISGRIMDADGDGEKGLSSVTIHLVGQPKLTQVTKKGGQFLLKSALWVEGFSNYIETISAKGFTQRHEIRVHQNESQIYHLSNRQIETWIGQLEGGVSSGAGLLIGAAPIGVGSGYHASFTTLAEAPVFSPETYTMSETGQLLVKKPLNENLPRFVVTQIPEGPGLMEVYDEKAQLIWSNLIFSSPSVVNVIRPTL